MASAPDFPGRARLIQSIEQAHESGFSPQRLCRALENLYHEGGITLPPILLSAHPDRYTRRLLHTCTYRDYDLIAMTWGPGQGSPLHDHDGHWCVECLWQGQLEITQHSPRERNADGQLRFATQPPTRVYAGQGDWLDATAQYHTMRNPDPAITAVSLHLYPRAFRQCGRFDPAENGWHQRHGSDLSLDAWN